MAPETPPSPRPGESEEPNRKPHERALEEWSDDESPALSWPDLIDREVRILAHAARQHLEHAIDDRQPLRDGVVAAGRLIRKAEQYLALRPRDPK